MKAGVFQFCPKFGEVEGNLNLIENALSKVDADLIVLPELCTTGYQFTSHDEVEALCESVLDGSSIRRFIQLCEDRQFYLVVGIGERSDTGCYNSSVLIGPKGHIGTYRKVHLFNKEKTWFKQGDLGFPVWDIGLAKIGMMICFDWIFPEAARSIALQDADILCHPANLVLPFCPDAMITRSIENRIFTITANRTGTESREAQESFHFIGQSQMTSSKGDLFFRMGEDESGVHIVEIDPTQARNKQITETNQLWDDRHPETYIINRTGKN
ncbi:acyltransferase [candidate division KSB1 bacterium]|nr:acyltransferase [candidate division KSB1 bacterium]